MRNLQLDGYVYALLLTARDAKDHIIAGLEAGADDYLIKPVHEAELIARLNAGRRILAPRTFAAGREQRNRILSITDALTGAYNRRYLMEQLPRELERCRRYAYPLSVIMCDIDHFKAINDARGHARGRRRPAAIRGARAEIHSHQQRLGGAPRRRGIHHRAAGNRARGRRDRRGEDPHRHGRDPVHDPERRVPRSTASFGVASTGAQGPDLALKVDALIALRGRMPVSEQTSGPQSHHRPAKCRTLLRRRLDDVRVSAGFA